MAQPSLRPASCRRALLAGLLLSALSCRGEPPGSAARPAPPAAVERAQDAGTVVAPPAGSPRSGEAVVLRPGEAQRIRTVVDDRLGLYALAHGFGPTDAGAAGAAERTVAALMAAASSVPRGAAPAWLARALEGASDAIHGSEDGPPEERHGATVAALLLEGGWTCSAHVGNVGAFRMGSRRIERLFLPHTIVEDFIRTEGLDDAEAEAARAGAPHRHVVVRALGVGPSVEVELHRGPLRAGETLVLASPGVTVELTPERMGQILLDARGGAESRALALATAANAAGGATGETAAAVVVEIP